MIVCLFHSNQINCCSMEFEANGEGVDGNISSHSREYTQGLNTRMNPKTTGESGQDMTCSLSVLLTAFFLVMLLSLYAVCLLLYAVIFKTV